MQNPPGRIITALFVLGCMNALANAPMTRIYLEPEGIGAADDHAGTAVALDGDTALVGSPTAQAEPGVQSVAVGVYRLVGGVWQAEAVLAPAGAAGNFGMALSISGDVAVIGASSSIATTIYTYSRTGSVWQQVDAFSMADPVGIAVSGNSLLVGDHVYLRAGNGWQLQASLQVDAGEVASSVAMDGDIAVVGTQTTQFPEQQAFVSFYSRAGTSWSREGKIDQATFSPALAVSGQTAIVGKEGQVNAYVRDQGVWTLQGALDPLALLPGFGASVSLQGDRAVVGSPRDGVSGIFEAGTAYVFERSGGVWLRTAHVADASPGQSGNFGAAVALSGDAFVAGAPGATTETGYRAGHAQLYTLDGGWMPTTTLDLGTAHVREDFGSAVAASASTLVAGAPTASSADGIGAAYLFERSGASWLRSVTLRPSPGHASMDFGGSISLSGDSVAIGAAREDISGAVYVFERGDGSWPLQARLDGGSGDNLVHLLGSSVALTGDRLAAGEPSTSDGGRPGLVRIWERAGSAWTPQAVLEASDGAAGAQFGYSVALSGDTLAASAPRADIGIEQDAGAVYVYTGGGGSWTLQQKVVAPVPATSAGFGLSVALIGDTLVVGAGGPHGGAYVYQRSGVAWAWQATLSVMPPASAEFGRSVALSEDADTALVGAPGEFGHPGYAYAFHRSGTDWALASTLQSPLVLPLSMPNFGISVALAGEEAFVGAPDERAESVFVASLGDAVFSDGFDPP